MGEETYRLEGKDLVVTREESERHSKAHLLAQKQELETQLARINALLGEVEKLEKEEKPVEGP